MHGDGPGWGEGGAAEVLLVADAGPGREDALSILAATGRRIAADWSWADADGLSGRGAMGAILVEAQGVDPARLEAVLPLIDAQARALALPLIVALGEEQIDLISANLASARLLVDPTLTERVTELIAATTTGAAALHDPARGGEAARLAQFAQEVARVAETLARLARDGHSSATVADRTDGYAAPPAEPVAVSAAEVRNAIRARRLRDQFFGPGLFEDPVWDILLDLFAADLEGLQVSVSSLCIAAAVAPTTALRWIARLSEGGWLERRPDPDDRRRAFLALSARARDAMDRYCAAMRRAGLPIG